MTISERILAHLEMHPEGATDRALAEALGLSRPQHANNVCRALQQQGLVVRQQAGGKNRNFLVDSPVTHIQRAIKSTLPTRPWYWEGNVQSKVVSHLAAKGHRILRVADTASREAGKDIFAETSSGQDLWVNVKGYPDPTRKTQAPTQARHWLAEALYDLLLWRGEDPDVLLALALPDFRTYRNNISKIAWVIPIVRVSVYWVTEDGVTES